MRWAASTLFHVRGLQFIALLAGNAAAASTVSRFMIPGQSLSKMPQGEVGERGGKVATLHQSGKRFAPSCGKFTVHKDLEN